MRWQETGREHLVKGDSVDTVRSMVATTSDSTFFDGEFLLHSTLLQNTMKCFRMKAAMKASLKFNAKPPEGTL